MKKNTTEALSVFALAVVLALLSLSFRSIAAEAAYPVERAKRTFVQRVWNRVVWAFRSSGVLSENARLKREVSALSVLRTDLDRLENENARLRRALEYKAKAPETWLAAGVLSEGGGAASPHRTIRVDKGSEQGVTPNAVVVVPEGLVGRITEVSPHTSVVLLVTDPANKVDCSIEGADGAGGILVGGNENLLTLRYLRGGDLIPPRARVLTSGVGGRYPKGFEVGTYLKDGEVVPSVDFASLEDVFIRRAK